MRASKAQVLRALLERIEADVEALTTSQQSAQASATHPEARAEHAKDTRATETSYLARGLADRVQALRDAATAVGSIEPVDLPNGAQIALGALVGIEDEAGTKTRYFIAPAGGGVELDFESGAIRVVTPRSPLGRSLLGRCVGDEIELRTPRGVRYGEVFAVD